MRDANVHKEGTAMSILSPDNTAPTRTGRNYEKQEETQNSLVSVPDR